MIATFMDLDDCTNSLNGVQLYSGADWIPLHDKLKGRSPFMVQLQLDDERIVDIGLADAAGCVQISPQGDGDPYGMATSQSGPRPGHAYIEFSVGGTATPIDARYVLPLRTVTAIVESILDGRDLPDGIFWEDYQ